VTSRRFRISTGALLLALAAGASSAAESQVEIHADLSPDPVGLDEFAVFTLQIDAPGFGLPRVDPGFLLDNLEGNGGPSTSQSTSWVNGQSSSRIQLVWRLRPKHVGVARVHDIRLELDHQVREVPEVSIKVVEKAPPGRAQPPARQRADPMSRLFEDDPFGLFPRRQRSAPTAQPKIAVRSLVEPTHLWTGQQATWTLALDTQTDISGFRPRALPTFAGFWTREVELPERPRPDWIEIGGEKFGRVPMMRRALFPLRPGKLRIDGLTTDVLARMADEDWIGMIRRDEPLELATPAVTIEVRPLPSGPTDASGVVGTLEMKADVQPAQLDVGQATTIVVSLTSDGNLQGLTPPELALPPGLRSFAPAVTSQERVVGGRLFTDLEWRYVVLADRGGEYELAAPSLTYFDPAGERYAHATAGDLRLTVRPGAAELAARARTEGVDDNSAATRAQPATSSLLPRVPVASLAVFGAAGALLVGAAIFWRRRGGRSEAIRRLRSELAAARDLDAPRDAARAIDEAWRRYLADRHALSRSVPVSQWSDQLGGRGWRSELVDELRTLYEEIQLLEFAPELSDAEALRAEVVRGSLRLARRLR